MDNRAVSPVMAVLTMVSIAVTLSAAFFLVARSLDDNAGDSAPPIGLVEDETRDRATVALGENEADWHFILASSSVDARMAFGAEASLGATPLPAGQQVAVAASARPVQGSDFVDFCAQGPVPVPAVIVLTYDEPGHESQVLREFHFALLDPCA